MQIALRCDASVEIGTGHVMRCLTLAEALRVRGHVCRFVCRDLPGHLGPQITARSFDLALLPRPEGPLKPDSLGPAHDAWAGVSWETDAAQTRAGLAGPLDWLIVDHYAFDARWQSAVRPQCARLMVIDDLADRPHAADLLLDQNLGREAADYDALLPDGAERLIGPRHALLRPEFAKARPEALARRNAGPQRLRHIFLFLGGLDLPDVTSRALHALAAAKPPDLEEVTVVMGSQAPALDKVRALATTLPFATRVLTGVTDMAALMAEGDLAIGASGGAAWERCALGLPSLVVVLADNQAQAAQALHNAGAARSLGRAEAADFEARLAQALAVVAAPEALSRLSAAASGLTGGGGALRVAMAMEQPLRLRRATAGDGDMLWHWRQSLPTTAFRSGANPPLAQHLDWIRRALDDPMRRLFIAEGTVPLGHLRLDLAEDGTALVSILLAREARGRNLAARLLGLLELSARQTGCTELRAEVHEDNASSRAAFLAAGYAPGPVTAGFVRYARHLPSRVQRVN